MRQTRITLVGWLLLCCAAFLWPVSHADAKGLYGDEGKDVKSGDLNSQDYWWTKYDMMMLAEDLKKWLEDNKPVAEKLYKDLKEKIRR